MTGKGEDLTCVSSADSCSPSCSSRRARRPSRRRTRASRLLGPEVTRNLGQPLVVESKPGASSVIGVDAAAKAKPDGYTYVLVGPSFSTNATLVPRLPYDSLRDLQPVGLLAATPQVLVANPKVAASSLEELVGLLKQNPDMLTYASFGNGTTSHLAGEQFKRAAGVSVVGGGWGSVERVVPGFELTRLINGQPDPRRFL